MLQQHKINVRNSKNENLKEISINVFDEISMEKISKIIKWQQSKARLNNTHTKDVSEVVYSTKKLRNQKGGGCARHRNKGAVQFRGGATIFGPEGRNYEYKINKKEKVLGLKHALSLKVKNSELLVVDEINFKNSTVKEFFNFKKIYNIDTNSILIIDEEKSLTILKAINNLYEPNFLPVVGINVLSIVKNQILIITEKALKVLQERGVL